MKRITVRPAAALDYQGFVEAEKKAWEGTGVPIISSEQFHTWLNVFPEGFLVALYQNHICGHIFSQCCDIDPYSNQHPTWDVCTDLGFARTTHMQQGKTLYAVSFSASRPGAGKLLLQAAHATMRERKQQYYAGACRVPGLAVYAEQHQCSIEEAVEGYVDIVQKSMNRTIPKEERISDPTLSVVLRTGMHVCKALPGYFEDAQSGDAACLVMLHNREAA